ncbi:MAG: N-acetylneuraminate synthase family protein [Pseudodesulfovibrio sp.]
MQIGNRRISDDSPCFIIAEIGHNHQGSLDVAKQLFKAAQQCGVDAVKLQKRHNRSLFTREMYDSAYTGENSYGATYGEHREALEFGAIEFMELKRYAEELGLLFFSTAFDLPSVDFLEEIGVPLYKVASGDLTNLPLLRRIARTGKPMIISTGGASMDEVRKAYETITPLNANLCVLQCTSAYPAQAENMNLRVIETFRREFPAAAVGLSDHQNGIAMALAGYMLGARVIEKHFTLDRSMRGTDHAFSLEPGGMRRLVRDVHRARLAMGDGVKRRQECENKPMHKLSKKLVAARDLPAGTVLAPGDIAAKSPSDGVSPIHFDAFVGQVTVRPLRADENLEWECIGSAKAAEA